ncbi:metallophosphoesterase [Puniceicoccales bacterium CK1056]|uniref:Metallophosphoesterase n=1 Tax=Oceanipulchritudo coccoides TaxID=2706888 RepID=A0A6B2LXL3_9BACT|nr:metallophosphoesterase [Oceanipulchritudo coccoides]NDV60832.1 metallophosphoesterase [Oceanipulchritudo coccoides]
MKLPVPEDDEQAGRLLHDMDRSEFPGHWDPEWVEKRWQLEHRRREKMIGSADEDGIHLPFHYRFLRWGLKAVGLYARGHRNFLDVRIRELEHHPARWPAALDGFRILQITDLHIDLDPALQPVLRRLIPSVECDLAVITGDYWEGAGQHPSGALEKLEEILKLVGNPTHGIYGVLGNHDTLPLAASLEKMGLPILINEAVQIGNGPAEFSLAGVDDPFFFRTDDVNKAASGCRAGIPRILLSHSPQVAPEADENGFCLVLSGHTHGGQICLPGGHALLSMERIPTPLFRGLWRRGSMIGYTSTGTGSCHVPVRYNCPPEIVIHTLRSSS